METLRRFKASSYAVSIIYIIVGLIMLLNPDFVSSAVSYVIGALMIIYGIIYSISLYQKREIEIYGKFDLLAGIMCISFGLFLIFNPNILNALLPFCTGIILLMDAIRFIISGFKLRKYGFRTWGINFVVGFIFLGFSIFIIAKSQEISLLILRFIGAALVIDAILDFITEICYRRAEKKVPEKYDVIEAQIEED